MRFTSPRDHAYRIGNSASRSTIPKADDTKVIQEHSIKAYAEEAHDGIEAFSNYGFTQVPVPPSGEGDQEQSAEGITLYLGSHRSHGIVIAHGDRRYRLFKLENGEVAMHDDQGHQVHLSREGIFASAPNSKKIVMQIMDDDKMPQDGVEATNGQKLGQTKQKGRASSNNITLTKDSLVINHTGQVTINAANIDLVASGDLNLMGSRNFLVHKTYLGVDSKSEVVDPIVPDVDLDPAKQTYVKIS